MGKINEEIQETGNSFLLERETESPRRSSQFSPYAFLPMPFSVIALTYSNTIYPHTICTLSPTCTFFKEITLFGGKINITHLSF